MKKNQLLAVTVVMMMCSVCGCGHRATESEVVLSQVRKAKEYMSAASGMKQISIADSGFYTENCKEVIPTEEASDLEDPVDKRYQEVVEETEEKIKKSEEEKNLNNALMATNDALEEYPDDEYLTTLRQSLIDQAPNYFGDDDVVEKKYSKIGQESLTGVYGQSIAPNFNINLGGGNVSVALQEKYSYIRLKAMLTNQSPTKARVDIDIYGDGNWLYSYEDFNTETGVLDIWLNVEGINTLTINSADHDHLWVGEASLFKPDTACHFLLLMYEERDMKWVNK